MLLMVNHECISSIARDVSSNISFPLKCKMITDGFFCRLGFDTMFLKYEKKLRLASSVTYASKSKSIFIFQNENPPSKFYGTVALFSWA